jgi:putative addiction module CopG family antidote
MTIHLPEDLEHYVRAKVQSGHFASEEDAITEAVRLLRLAEERATPKTETEAPPSEPTWQRVLKIMANVPDSVFDRIPTDGSAQLDHYIYGSARQPNP